MIAMIRRAMERRRLTVVTLAAWAWTLAVVGALAWIATYTAAHPAAWSLAR